MEHPEKKLSQEERWLYFGGGPPTMEDLPPLHSCRQEPGKSTYTALKDLLNVVETEGRSRSPLRAVMASLYCGSEQPVVLSEVLNYLPPDVMQALLKVMTWANWNRGLHLDDFEDGGARFLRLILRKRPTTIARILHREAA